MNHMECVGRRRELAEVSTPVQRNHFFDRYTIYFSSFNESTYLLCRFRIFTTLGELELDQILKKA